MDMADWVAPRRFVEVTGYTLKALDRKRQRGVWQEGVHFKKVDGGILYSIKAHNQWVEKAPIQGSSATAPRSASRSPSTVSAVGSR